VSRAVIASNTHSPAVHPTRAGGCVHSLSGYYLRNGWRNGVAGWRETAVTERTRWFLTLLIGTAAGAGLMYFMTWMATRMEAAGQLGWERDFLLQLEQRYDWSFYRVSEMGIVGSSMFLVPLLIAVSANLIHNRRPLLGLSLILGYGLLSFTVSWDLWHRPRPDFIEYARLASPKMKAFPSGHMAHTAFVYGVLAWLVIRASRSALEKVLAIFLAAFVVAVIAFSRLRLGVHWPSDIVAGAFIGLMWIVVVAIANRHSPRTQ